MSVDRPSRCRKPTAGEHHRLLQAAPPARKEWPAPRGYRQPLLRGRAGGLPVELYKRTSSRAWSWCASRTAAGTAHGPDDRCVPKAASTCSNGWPPTAHRGLALMFRLREPGKLFEKSFPWTPSKTSIGLRARAREQSFAPNTGFPPVFPGASRRENRPEPGGRGNDFPGRGSGRQPSERGRGGAPNTGTITVGGGILSVLARIPHGLFQGGRVTMPVSMTGSSAGAVLGRIQPGHGVDGAHAGRPVNSVWVWMARQLLFILGVRDISEERPRSSFRW